MKKLLWIALLGIVVIVIIAAIANTGDGNDNNNSGGGKEPVTSSDNNNGNNLGDYTVEIKSCRLAEDYEGKDVVIVKYSFTNNADKSAAFYLTFKDSVYQNDVGLNKSYVVDDSYNYSADNQTKEIKKGATIDVEVAYELNDTKTDIEVEVSELISLNDKKITKTFSIED
ncbi:MAG: DUF5067 domain-containing protein [Oscillospiraceae bacterium]|nr:DUF5067 domain-containing protein [Oscillospiraceae bacterium]